MKKVLLIALFGCFVLGCFGVECSFGGCTAVATKRAAMRSNTIGHQDPLLGFCHTHFIIDANETMKKFYFYKEECIFPIGIHGNGTLHYCRRKVEPHLYCKDHMRRVEQAEYPDPIEFVKGKVEQVVI